VVVALGLALLVGGRGINCIIWVVWSTCRWMLSTVVFSLSFFLVIIKDDSLESYRAVSKKAGRLI